MERNLWLVSLDHVSGVVHFDVREVPKVVNASFSRQSQWSANQSTHLSECQIPFSAPPTTSGVVIGCWKPYHKAKRSQLLLNAKTAVRHT